MFDERNDPVHLLQSLKSFLGVWHQGLPHWYGIAPEKLAETPLPDPLRRLYEFAGHWPADNFYCSAFANQDYLLPFELLVRQDGRLFFAGENQGCWHCSTELEGDDPPVWISDGETGWQPLCDSLAQFLVTLCLHETVFGAPFLGYGDGVIERFRNQDRQVVPLWLQGPYASAIDDPPLTHHSFHLAGNVLIMDDRWCATHHGEIAVSFPDLLKSRAGSIAESSISKPLWENPEIPAVVRRNILNMQARQHQEQADFHSQRADRFLQLAAKIVD